MAEIFKFFNSAPGDERWHYASDFADYFGNVLSSGLLHKNGTPNLQVKVNAGTMQTYVEAGEALIQGYQYQNTQPLFLTHGLPEPNLDRIDRIVLRLDKRNNARYIRLFVKEGVSATNPVPPALQRDQYVFELTLAQIRLTKNTSSLEPLKLVDERMKEDLCGIVYSLISVPTSVFQQQWDYWFNLKKQTLEDDMEAWQLQQKNDFETWQAIQKQEYLTWIESIKDILDENVAANLAARIAELEQTVGPLKQTVDTHVYDISQHTYHALDTGTANAKVVTLPIALTSYIAGLTIRFENKILNTGAVTVNVNGLGVKNVVKPDGSAITPGDLKAGGVYTISYSGTLGNFTLQGSGGKSTPAYWGNGSDGTFDADTTTRSWSKSPNSDSINIPANYTDGLVLFTWTANKPTGLSTIKFRYARANSDFTFALETSIDNINWIRHFKFTTRYDPMDTSELHFNNIYSKYIRFVLVVEDTRYLYAGTITIANVTITDDPMTLRYTDTYHGICLRQYENFTLPASHNISVHKPTHGLVIMSKGDITINGTIDMNYKALGSNASYALSSLFPKHPNSNIYEILGLLGELRGGFGGPGGFGGGTAYAVPVYRSKGGIPDKTPTICGGFGAGGGGGGSGKSDYTGAYGGNGGDSGKSWANLRGPEYITASKGTTYGVSGSLGQGGNGSGTDASSTDNSNRSYVKQGPGGPSQGAGGGGGGGGYTNTYNNSGADGGYGGAGQGAGGFVLLMAKGKITINTGARIEANGGNGGNGGSGNSYGANPTEGGASGGGGGGGAGGGCVLMLYGDTYSNAGTISVNGGSNGAGGYPSTSQVPGIEWGGSGGGGTSGTILNKKVGS
ncbi:hypothetical protein EP18_03885 [Lysinibacillus sphaericus]|nr:hypothetical protein [Lysinibacillus sphaericus]KEK13013.1 hypothetical protein EP18_03885 [Lysinibacillus sphaericus]